MPQQPSRTRRSFLKSVAAASALAPVTARALDGNTFELSRREEADTPVGPNDRIRIATIGMGIIGFADTEAALQIPGVELVAISDLYDGRRVHAQEVFGKQVKTYVDYREILERDDIDAVLICVPDHWHAQMTIEAMRAGKAVYCEKPMVKSVEEGPDVIRVQKETGAVLQIGSQYASNILYDKARELIAAGAIGPVNTVEARYNRNNDVGAWQYSIPLDASPETVDWDRFLGSAPQRPFDATRFFRWRNYWDYGTAVAGDLFVHLFTAIHHATKAIGPNTVSAMGGLRYWNDGREVYDMLLGLFDYAQTDQHGAFTVALQSNFEDGSGGGTLFRFVGPEGAISMSFTEMTVSRVGITEASNQALLKGYNSVKTFSDAQQQAFAAHLKSQPPTKKSEQQPEEKYVVPRGYSDRHDHFTNFFRCVRTKSDVYEDAVFGLRAAGPALLANRSYREQRQIQWDPKKMVITG